MAIKWKLWTGSDHRSVQLFDEVGVFQADLVSGESHRGRIGARFFCPVAVTARRIGRGERRVLGQGIDDEEPQRFLQVRLIG